MELPAFAKNLRFPIYEKHEDVKCFSCEASLADADIWLSGFPSGKYMKKCYVCPDSEGSMKTFYDIKEEAN